MKNRQKAAKPDVPMSVMDAIYHRRAVRNYTPRTIARAVLRKLLDAAVHAPTAMHEEPWSFAVIQDKALLNRQFCCRTGQNRICCPGKSVLLYIGRNE